MNKKFISPARLAILTFTLAIILFGLFSSFGSAGSFNPQTTKTISQGWNLLYGFNPDTSAGSLQSHIKAIYALNPQTQEYVRLSPSPENSKISKLQEVAPSLSRLVVWVYSDTRLGDVQYSVSTPNPVDNFKLYKGWNFITLTSDDISKYTINELRGTCNIQKTETWMDNSNTWDDETGRLRDDANAADWTSNEKIPAMPETFQQPAIFVVKVEDDCNLANGGGIVNPPALP